METNSPKALKILKASAGSGKTFSLTRHFIILLFSGKNKYREILAVTFTNKATAEMKQRVLQVLQGLAQGSSGGSTEIFRDSLKEAYPKMTDEEIRERARLIYRSILHDYSRFSISTIDKFVQKVIRGFAYELGIEAGFRLEMNYGKVTRELSEKLHRSLEEKPELLQWIMDYATTQIALNETWSYERTLLKLAQGIFSEDYQEFEEAMKEDKDKMVFKEMTDLIYTLRERYEEESRAYFNRAKSIFSKSGLAAEDFKNKNKSPLLKLARDHQEGWIEKLEKCVGCPEEWNKNTAVTETLYKELNPILEEMLAFHREVYPGYVLAGLLRSNLYYLRLIKEMSDLLAVYRTENMLLLISDATNLLNGISKGQEDNPSFIWEKMGNRYKHFLFDEFQDTSERQWQNFLPLIKNALGEFSGQRTENLIVGDVKQSIYRWRNGNWRLLHSKAATDLGEQFVVTEDLLENYRSAVNIINFNNMVFDYGPKWLQETINKKIEEEAGETFFNTAWKSAGYDTIIKDAYNESRQDIPQNSTKFGGRVDVNSFPVASNKNRLSQVRDDILKDTADTLYRWLVDEKRYKAGQIGILVRNKKDALALIDYLREDQAQREIKNAFQIISGDALKIEANDSIKLLINALYLLSAGATANSIYKANCIQLYRQVKTLKDAALQPVSSEEWLRIGSSDLTALTEFLPEKLCRNTVQLAEMPLPELTEQLISLFSLNDEAAYFPYLFAFRDIIANFTQQGEQGIAAFLEWWEEEKEELALPDGEGNNVVQVMTIHKSKGLAYDVVMLPFAGWEIGGSIRGEQFWVSMKETPFAPLKRVPVPFEAKLNNTALQFAYWEEKLMRSVDALNELYVALTRAKSHLYINVIGKGTRDLNTFLVSDIIRCALKEYEKKNGGPFLLEADKRQVPDENKKAEDTEAWDFSTYPQARRLGLQLTKEVKNQLERLNSSLARRLGILAHEALSRIKTRDDLGPVLLAMKTEGLFRQAEWETIKETVQKALNNEALKALLELPYEQLNEQTIIDIDGKSYRPDKVLISEKETIIIDFKFTTEAKRAHVEQIETYKNLLFQMGYPGVKAYLFYGYLDKLVNV